MVLYVDPIVVKIMLHITEFAHMFSEETFIFFNKQMKGNKREIIQFGVPLFQSTTEGESKYPFLRIVPNFLFLSTFDACFNSVFQLRSDSSVLIYETHQNLSIDISWHG